MARTITSIEMARLGRALDKAFREATIIVRDAMGEANIGSFTFQVKASGRTLTDRAEVKIEYRITENDWTSSGGVEGDGLEAVLLEQLRRHGWSLEHKPLALPPAVAVVDEA